MKNIFKLIIVLSFVASIPSWLNAQQRFEISVGVSTPGFHTWEKYGGLTFGESFDYPDEYERHSLSNMDSYAYKSSYYPSFSVQAAYKLPDHGFTKRLSVLAYAGLITAVFEKIDYLTNKSLYAEKAYQMNLLVGARFHIVTKESFMMYSQALVGAPLFKDKSLYWDYNLYLRENPFTAQVTFLGFRFQSPHGLCFIAEMGEGSEYSLGRLIVIPGVRLSLGYTF